MLEVIGIDPGLTGGITWLDDCGGIIRSIPMPTYKVKKGDKKKTQIDITAVLINTVVPGRKLFIEMQQARPRDGKVSAGTTVGNYMKILGAFEGWNYALSDNDGMEQREVYPVTPATWMNKVFRKHGIVKNVLDDDNKKSRSFELAKKLWPDFDFKKSKRCKILHDGMVDSALIAYYGYLRLKEKNDEKNQ